MSRSRNKGACIAPAGSRMEPEPELTDEQWFLIEDLFPTPAASPHGGRPTIPPRACVEGILWILRTGARWKDLPNRFPSPTTCWRRLRDWTAAGLWEQAWSRLLRRLDAEGRVNTEETFADGTFSSAKKGVNASARRKRGKGTKIMVHSDAAGVPLGVHISSASSAMK